MESTPRLITLLRESRISESLRLLSRQGCSPTDIDYTTGENAFHVLIRCFDSNKDDQVKAIDLAKRLHQYGVNLHDRDYSRKTAQDACKEISNIENESFVKAIISLFCTQSAEWELRFG